ncbi:bifunctional deaminase-reductase domain protein [candidate division TM7 genomosp. GTL1]|nr:bifunctional deaminase-reductase domain protein [candidate division TM7 genomosp. GTL1]
MRKVIVVNRISIDGYFASNNEATAGMDWFVQDPEVDKAVHKPVHSDTLLLGEKTFDLFERSWVPMLNDPNTPPPLKAIAQELTDMQKIVFTKADRNSEWENTEFHRSGLIEFVEELKKQDGKDILILGSGTIVQQLANESLIDEYQFIVSPIVAGEGKPLFKGVKQHSLKLLSVESFDSGNVVLRYETV